MQLYMQVLQINAIRREINIVIKIARKRVPMPVRSWMKHLNIDQEKKIASIRKLGSATITQIII